MTLEIPLKYRHQKIVGKVVIEDDDVERFILKKYSGDDVKLNAFSLIPASGKSYMILGAEQVFVQK